MTLAQTIVLPARAKLNLDLEVLGRREDGFHELRTTFQAIELHDLLEIQVDTGAAEALTISGLAIPDADQNSVLKAHRALEEAAGRSLPARFHLTKVIPPGSGMGGASSDAAAALRGLKAMHGLDLDLLPIARRLGADVAFFVCGGAAQAAGRGDVLTRLPVEKVWFAIAWPGYGLSTAAVYSAWDEVGGEPPNGLRRAAERVEPRLHEFARELASTARSDGWQLTGSGSAFFRRCKNEAEAVAIAAPLRCWTAVTCAVDAWA